MITERPARPLLAPNPAGGIGLVQTNCLQVGANTG
jgi:hypothetical protein